MINLGLEWLVPGCLYACAIVAMLLSLFWRPITGIYFLVPLIPLQTIRYRINDFPLGSSLVYLMLIGVALGLLRKGETILPKTPWTLLLAVYLVFSFLSLCQGSFYLGFPLPWWANDRRFPDWCDAMTMPVLFFLVVSAVKTPTQIKSLVLLMCISVLMLDKSFWNTVSGHDFSTYSEDLREGGTMGYAGSNGLATFEAQYATFLIALATFERKFLLKLVLYGLALFCAICLMYSLSRGGYVALAAGCLFLGVVKMRKLLLAMVVFGATWTTIVPQAVVNRVEMTYDANGSLDHSAETRVELWEDAARLIDANLLMGTGYDTYRYMNRVGTYEDTHNIYLKILVETGVIGLLLFIGILVKTFSRSFSLFRHHTDPFVRGMGLGLAGWVICAAVANAFGDRWTYFQIQGLFWVLAGMVARSWMLLQEEGASARSKSPAAATPARPRFGPVLPARS